MAAGANAGDLVGGIVGADTKFRQSQDWDKLANGPGFINRDYDQIGYAGDFNPQMYNTPEAAQYQTISEDPRTRDYQMQALSRMQQYADQGANSAEAMGRYNAVSDANAVAAQQNAGIRNQMAMRGQGGTGMEFVLQQQAAQNAANRAQSAGLNSAQQAALQRLQGIQGVMNGASNVRGMDANIAGQNADIINKFNMYNTGARNQVNQGNVDMQNAAGMRNLGTRQGIMGTNTGIRNQSLDRNDRNTAIGYQSTKDKMLGKFGIQDDQTGAIAQATRGGVGLAGDFIQAGGAGMGG